MSQLRSPNRRAIPVALLIGAHVLLGGVRMVDLGSRRETVPRTPEATSDVWLRGAGVGASEAMVEALVAQIPSRDAIYLVAPSAEDPYPAWPFLSHAVWPHHLYVYHCDAAGVHPYIWPNQPEPVPWLLYFDIEPPPALRTGVGHAGRLTLVRNDPSVPWTSYCSS